MDLLFDSLNIPTHRLDGIYISFVVFSLIKGLHNGAYELNQNHSTLITGILPQE